MQSLFSGVALLPFVDEKRLWKALATVYPDLTPAESEYLMLLDMKHHFNVKMPTNKMTSG